MAISKEFVVERQGRSFVLYAGLLDEAHRHGLKSIRTQLIQIPNQENGNTAICFAEVETERGHFTGVGDASPENVARMIVPHIPRMAETRAKARALRDATNIGMVALEELGPDVESEAPAELPKQSVAETAPVSVSQVHTANGAVTSTQDVASPAQINAIQTIGRLSGMSSAELNERAQQMYSTAVEKLTRAQASSLIKLLQIANARQPQERSSG